MDADHLSGRLHARPNGRIHPTQLGGRESRSLDSRESRRWQEPVRPAHRGQVLAERDADGQLHHGHARDLG